MKSLGLQGHSFGEITGAHHEGLGIVSNEDFKLNRRATVLLSSLSTENSNMVYMSWIIKERNMINVLK